MHLQPITHPGVLEALPTEIGFLNYERSVGLWTSELPAVREGVDNRNNHGSRGTQNSSDFLAVAYNVLMGCRRCPGSAEAATAHQYLIDPIPIGLSNQ